MGPMTTATTPATHPLVEKHSADLDAAAAALAARSYYSRYPESPSPRVYGEGAAEQGKAAYEAHLGRPFEALADQPTDGTTVGDEVSPYGPALGVGYPHLDVDAAVAAAEAAGGTVLMPPTDNGWVVKAQVADPAGNRVSLIAA